MVGSQFAPSYQEQDSLPSPILHMLCSTTTMLPCSIGFLTVERWSTVVRFREPTRFTTSRIGLPRATCSLLARSKRSSPSVSLGDSTLPPSTHCSATVSFPPPGRPSRTFLSYRRALSSAGNEQKPS